MKKPLFAFLIGLAMAPCAWGSSFPMPKTGEWKVKELDTAGSRGGNSGALECIEAQDRKRWEDDFKKAANNNGMDCQLTVKSETSSQLAYDIQCKGRRSENGSATQVYSQDAEGSLVWKRQSETRYTIEQEIKLLGMKADGTDPKGTSARQKRMMDAAMRHSSDASTSRMKNEYTFVSTKCSAAGTQGK